MKDIFLFLKKKFCDLKYNYSYYSLISHTICIGIGFFIYEILFSTSFGQEGFPLNSVVLTLDKNKFKNINTIKNESLVFITKAGTNNTYFCKIHSHPIKIININSNSYSFRIKKEDIIPIKQQILDSKSPYILNIVDKDSINNIKSCDTPKTRVVYE